MRSGDEPDVRSKRARWRAGDCGGAERWEAGVGRHDGGSELEPSTAAEMRARESPRRPAPIRKRRSCLLYIHALISYVLITHSQITEKTLESRNQTRQSRVGERSSDPGLLSSSSRHAQSQLTKLTEVSHRLSTRAWLPEL
jgi:hypothetical protein